MHCIRCAITHSDTKVITKMATFGEDLTCSKTAWIETGRWGQSFAAEVPLNFLNDYEFFPNKSVAPSLILGPGYSFDRGIPPLPFQQRRTERRLRIGRRQQRHRLGHEPSKVGNAFGLRKFTQLQPLSHENCFSGKYVAAGKYNWQFGFVVGVKTWHRRIRSVGTWHGLS